MKRKLKQVFLSMLVMASCGVIFSSAGFSAEEESYYTRMNMWYEKPSKIMSTNYHRGAILPVGTEVEILKEGNKIKFRDKPTGTEFRLILDDEYTFLTTEQFFERYFSKENILNGSEYASFSDKEKKNIKNGTIEDGMSKAATLVAWGYPPSHRTRSTDANTWTYWTSRMVTRVVYFENDKMSDVSKPKP